MVSAADHLLATGPVRWASAEGTFRSPWCTGHPGIACGIRPGVPSVCVCVRSGRKPCHHTITFSHCRGWQQGRESATNEDTLVTLVKQLEMSSCVPAMVVQSLFGPLFLSLCVLHVEPCNVFDTRGKPSALRAETYSCRTLSKPRLTSCT